MVGFFVKPVFYKIGTDSFLNSFFSTIYVKLENSDRGSKYPIIMNDLYKGCVKNKMAKAALKELEKLKTDLSKLPPQEVVWDFENLEVLPPWGNNISSDIKNLSDYFITSDGNNLLDVLKKALNTAIEIDKDLIIRSL